MQRILIFILSFALITTVNAQQHKSPNGNFELIFQLNKGIPTYRLSYKGKPIIKESKSLYSEISHLNKYMPDYVVVSIISSTKFVREELSYEHDIENDSFYN